jgi:hypothetical protein
MFSPRVVTRWLVSAFQLSVSAAADQALLESRNPLAGAADKHLRT